MEKNNNKPKLRFPGFTDPWEQRKLGEITNSYSGGTPSVGVKDYYNGDIPFIRSAEINSNCTELYITEKGLNSSSSRLVNEGDILYALYGATSGEVGIVKLKGAINQAILAIQPLPKYDAGYLVQWLRKSKQNIVNTYLQGGQGNLSGAIVKELSIDLPQYEEQVQISTFFSKIDNLITLHQRKLNHLQDKKKSLLQKMFPKNGEDFPELRFPGFTDPWEQRKLGEIVDVRSGRDYKHLSEGEIPVYGTGGYMLSVNEALSYRENAIGIGRKGTIDKPYILEAPFWTVDTLFYAVPENNHDLNFIFDIFQNINWKQKDESTGVPSLSKTVINDIDVLVSEYKEQKKIGNFFKNLDNLITLHQRKLNHLQEQKKALLQQMFI